MTACPVSLASAGETVVLISTSRYRLDSCLKISHMAWTTVGLPCRAMCVSSWNTVSGSRFSS